MHVPTAAIRPQLEFEEGARTRPLEILAQAPVPTKLGTFDMVVFRWGANPDNDLSPDHVALIKAGTPGDIDDLRGEEDVLVRVHSECLTSEVFGSLKCDCKEQLESAQAAIARAGRGVILYLRQEGRGIGLINKIRAYELQANGHDTVDANRILGLPDDARDYAPAAAMLDHLGVASVRLLTNNPLKVKALRALGVRVERAPHVIDANPFSAGYLEAKRLRMGHALPTLGGGDAE